MEYYYIEILKIHNRKQKCTCEIVNVCSFSHRFDDYVRLKDFKIA